MRIMVNIRHVNKISYTYPEEKNKEKKGPDSKQSQTLKF